MNQDITINEDGVEQIALKTYSQHAYLNYSMYVINDRALPHIADGLKQRGVTSIMRQKSLRRLLDAKPLVRIMEVHNGLSGLIVEKMARIIHVLGFDMTFVAADRCEDAGIGMDSMGADAARRLRVEQPG